jgi:oxygen-dependent protoporphyrinogen oxidase
MARSGILGPVESLRLAGDLVSRHPAAASDGKDHSAGDLGDRSVSDLVGPRLGRQVVDRLADPLIGGIHAGGVDHLSAAATHPGLLEASRAKGSLMRALGRGLAASATAPAAPSITGSTALPDETATPSDGSSAAPPGAPPNGTPAGPAPVFWSLAQGTAGLVTRLAAQLSSRGVTIRTGVTVDGLVPAAGRSGHRWKLSLGDGTTLAVDGVVVAVPAPRAASLLTDLAPQAAAHLAAIEYASVAVVTLALPPDALRQPLYGTGFLVPRSTRIGGRAALMTGCTYLSQKWPHLARPQDHLLRVSVGRFGDERPADVDDRELAATAVDELTHILDLRGEPSEWSVTRWPGAFPQYRVGHLDRVAEIDRGLGALPALALAGAAYRGVGIPACIGSGRAAARLVLDSLASTDDDSNSVTTGPSITPGPSIDPNSADPNSADPSAR